jgi:hypothetical protein
MPETTSGRSLTSNARSAKIDRICVRYLKVKFAVSDVPEKQ